MRTLLPQVAFGCMALLVLAPPSAAAAPPAAAGEVDAAFVDPDDPAVREVRRLAETAIRWLGAKLAYEIKTAVAQGGAENAVSTCHLRAVSSGAQVLPGMPSITAFKLTSERLLNAANAPDAPEQLALQHVRRAIARGDAPHDLLIQRLTAPDGSIEWRVYRPLAVLPSCLACHGNPDTQSPALRTRLREHAPAEAAIGYAAGDWRGLLRVTVTPPSARR